MEQTRPIAIYGRSGHGKVIADIAYANGYSQITWIDDNPELPETIRFETFLEKYRTMPVALGIGDNTVRASLYAKLRESGILLSTLIHPSATVSPSAEIGEGSVVMPHAVINADASIGKGVIVNTSAVIEHDNKIGDFAHISPNAALAGNVSVGERSHIGIGASIIQLCRIGADVLIAAGSAVTKDIPDRVMAAGIPAVVKKRRP
jgi:UDP-N-acetylbacillosamine N-acetyltransferase